MRRTRSRGSSTPGRCVRSDWAPGRSRRPTRRQWAVDKLRWIDAYTHYRPKREIFLAFDRYFTTEMREPDYIRYRLRDTPRPGSSGASAGAAGRAGTGRRGLSEAGVHGPGFAEARAVRILYVVTRADAVGGASIHVRDMAREMIVRGHAVIVLTGGEGPVTDLLQAAGVPYRPLRSLRRSIHPIRDLLAARELAAAVREFEPDLISVHTAKAGWIGRAVAARLGIPAIYTPHGWSIGDRTGAACGRPVRVGREGGFRLDFGHHLRL